MAIEFGIVAAMEAEYLAIKKNMQDIKEHIYGQFIFTQGILCGQNVVLLQSGIGKVSAAVGTTLLIEKFSPQYILNTGSAGGYAKKLKVGDVVISHSVAYHDVDVTSFGYKIGQMAGCEPVFYPSKNLLEIAMEIKSNDPLLYSGMIISGDCFVHEYQQQQKIQQNFPEADAIEMEAAGIAHACTLLNTPFLIIRSISDLVNSKDNHLSFNDFLPIAAKNSADVIMQILEGYSQQK